MENTTQPDSIFTFSFDSASRNYLKKAANWAKIGSICAFVGYLATLIALFVGKKTATITTYSETDNVTLSTTSTGGAGVIFGTVVSVLIGAFINYFLYRFATLATKGVDSMNQSQLNEGLGSLRTYFKILGIILLIVLIIGGLAFIAVVVSSALSRK